MRVAVEVLAAEADLLEEFHHALRQRRTGGLAIDLQRPSDDVLNEMARVDGGERVLEDHLAVAPEVPPGVALQAVDPVGRLDLRERPALRLAAVGLGHREECVQAVAMLGGEPEIDAAAGRVAEGGDAAAERGLAAAGFADEADRLAAPDVEANAVDRAHLADDALQCAFLDGEVLLQPAHANGEVVARGGRPVGEGRVRGHRHGVLD